MPLRVRSGARYTCFGDGLCCTDLHGLGPLTKKEVRALKLISEDVVLSARESGFDEPMLATRKDGGCLFLGEKRCDLHAAVGAEAKPEGCRRFPLGLTATPTGGRITTKHRCPCRTLGDRPELTAEEARPSLLNHRGRLSADQKIGNTVRLGPRRKVSFEKWEEIEGAFIDRLLSLEDPASVLDAQPFPRLQGSTWRHEARDMLKRGSDLTRFGSALTWFARALLALTGNGKAEKHDLPWGHEFDRAEARSPNPRDPKELFADWLADEIWAMEWAELDGSFARARADLATRYAVAKHIFEELKGRDLRTDRAAAEAISVVDLLGDSEWWEDIVDLMRV